MPKHPRPLSPHLQVYRPQLTSVLSVFHRGTGGALSVASVILIYWLWAVAAGPEAYATAQGLLHSWFGVLVVLGISGSIFYHLCTGVRHLIWDTAHGLDIRSVYRSGGMALFIALLLTLAFWFVALWSVGLIQSLWKGVLS